MDPLGESRRCAPPSLVERTGRPARAGLGSKDRRPQEGLTIAMQTISELDLLQSPLAPGLTVIEASAGTGKTYSISHLVPRLLLEGTLPDLSKLLLVTFTRDAARELAERVRRVLGDLAAPPAGDEAQKNPNLATVRSLLDRP